jgi:hypothetical protein
VFLAATTHVAAASLIARVSAGRRCVSSETKQARDFSRLRPGRVQENPNVLFVHPLREARRMLMEFGATSIEKDEVIEGE